VVAQQRSFSLENKIAVVKLAGTQYRAGCYPGFSRKNNNSVTWREWLLLAIAARYQVLQIADTDVIKRCYASIPEGLKISFLGTQQ
jgi:hypothetical protein